MLTAATVLPAGSYGSPAVAGERDPPPVPPVEVGGAGVGGRTVGPVGEVGGGVRSSRRLYMSRSPRART